MAASRNAEQAYTYAQLHEQACIVCGTSEEPLFGNGHLRVPVDGGEPLTWPVKACAADWGTPLC
ncbi:hypothetical protein EDD99_5429 [Streptomyces sp. 846.5]|nr:hypothetical protein [Streptomyces sp. 846.5]TDT97310.1 hypothetical protein EDD99_5429 [Streptomyces sp. 846.5]